MPMNEYTVRRARRAASVADSKGYNVEAVAVDDLIIEVQRLTARDERITAGCAKDNEDICQSLGRALGYPWYKDDQANFPGAAEADGVCVGEHVAATLADEAADRIRSLTAERDALEFLACAMFDCILNDGWQEENVRLGVDQLRAGGAKPPDELVVAVRRCAGLEGRP